VLDDPPTCRTAVTKPGGGVWLGRTAIDGMDCIPTFERVPGSDPMVITGVTAARP
jgi:hypothetical protein